MASNQPKQFDRSGSKPSRKVRVVAKVRGFSGPEADSGSEPSRTVEWVSVNKPQGENSEGVTISFGEQSSSRYLVDYCYEEHEENEMIYSREVKPLISAVFEGHNSTVIAYGARGSGKTHLIQGSAEKPGLAVLATTEFLSTAEKNGKSIAISFYEVDHQEHAVDLLNPEQPPILVFEDRGRIQFKGLTQIPVKSIAEFQNLYFTACSAQKAPKKSYERAHRSHVGLIVHVFSLNESAETSLVSKMIFVDLAGYEDARKKSSDGSCLAEINKINKSIYALMNVCHALSTNESRVPYRESKLTRMLQDSLRGTSRILMVACLNPSFCQDTIYMVSLASRSCQWKNRTPLDSTKRSGSSARKMVTSQNSQIPKSVSTTAKKLPGSRSHIYEKKATVPKSATKGRKLFDDASHSTKADKARSLSDTGSTFETSVPNEEISIAHVTKASEPLLDNSLSETRNHAKPNPRVEKDNSFLASSNVKLNPTVENDDSSLSASSEVELDPIVEKDDSSLSASSEVELDPIVEKDNSFLASSNVKLNPTVENDDSSLNASSEAELDPIVEKGISRDSEDHQEKHTTYARSYSEIVQEGMNKENNSLMANEDGSPPISSQLRDLSNSLKSLYSSTPLSMQIPENECVSLDDQMMSSDIVEPKTPVIEQNMSVNDRWDVINAKSPWETYSMRGSGMKNSLVHEYLRFLNTANKEELKKLKGIGEKRANFILELREESPEPFKSLDDLKDIGLSAKQIKGMMKKEVGELFN